MPEISPLAQIDNALHDLDHWVHQPAKTLGRLWNIRRCTTTLLHLWDLYRGGILPPADLPEPEPPPASTGLPESDGMADILPPRS